MSNKTAIEWTDYTWNVIRGCSRKSPGCQNCYAEREAARIIRMNCGAGIPEGEGAYDGLLASTGQWNGTVRYVEKALTQPLSWRKPGRIFVNSMSDLFHESVAWITLAEIFTVMALAKHHTFQILTKRPENMLRFLHTNGNIPTLHTYMQRIAEEKFGTKLTDLEWPLPNVWLLVSVENQPTADERIPLLIQTPAAVRGISMEPLIGPVKLKPEWLGNYELYESYYDKLIDWVIVGGETAKPKHKARPMHPEWVYSIQEQCASHEVDFFFKQWGEWCPRSTGYAIDDNVPRIRLTDQSQNGQILGADGDNDVWMNCVGRKRAGKLLDGELYQQFPRDPF